MKPTAYLIAAVVALALMLGVSVVLCLRLWADHKAELRAIEVRQEEQAKARHAVYVEKFKAARAEGDELRQEAARAFALLEDERSKRPTPQRQTDEVLRYLDGSDVDTFRVRLHSPVN